MSDPNLARRAKLEVIFDGVNISGPLKRNLNSLTYTDIEEDDADDIDIQLNDREDIWLTQFIPDIKNTIDSEDRDFRIQATIIAENYRSDGKDKALPCGIFGLDDIRAKGPPSVISIKGTALPFSTDIRQTEKSRAWEGASLSQIGSDIAAANGMGFMFLAASNPQYGRIEQVNITDIKHLSGLCHNAEISLKSANNMLVLFDQADFEANPPVFIFKRKGGKYIKWDLHAGEADKNYASCRVSYTDPSGKSIEGIAYAEGANKKGPRLQVKTKVTSASEAKEIAASRLKRANRFQIAGVLTCPGNPDLMTGLTVELTEWGIWAGKYIIWKAVHTVTASGGYTTQVHLRHA